MKIQEPDTNHIINGQRSSVQTLLSGKSRVLLQCKNQAKIWTSLWERKASGMYEIMNSCWNSSICLSLNDWKYMEDGGLTYAVNQVGTSIPKRQLDCHRSQFTSPQAKTDARIDLEVTANSQREHLALRNEFWSAEFVF